MAIEAPEDLATRTKKYALMIIRLYAQLPKQTVAQVLGKQMLRAGTSIGAHYREAKHARSDAEFISKMEVGLQELNETLYWIELIEEAKVITSNQLQPLIKETRELLAIFTSIVKKVKQRRKK